MTEKQSSYTKQHRTLPPHIQAPLERALYINNHCCHLRMLRPHTAAARSSIHMPHHNVFHCGSHRGIYHTKPQSFWFSKACHTHQCLHATRPEWLANDLFLPAVDEEIAHWQGDQLGKAGGLAQPRRGPQQSLPCEWPTSHHPSICIPLQNWLHSPHAFMLNKQ